MLWAALAAGVAILAWMAWQLARQMRGSGSAS
jgi:threonine/homoserine/homoserine lactone efflux protein